jgi:hypothetical protein
MIISKFNYMESISIVEKKCLELELKALFN